MSNDEIIRLIGKIRERYDQVHEPSGSIVRIEVDLLRADIRELYERISLLTGPGTESPVAESEPEIAISEVVKDNTAILQPQNTQPEVQEDEAPIKIGTVSEPEFTSQVSEEQYELPRESVPEESVWDAENEIPPVFPEQELAFFQPEPVAVPIAEMETPHQVPPSETKESPNPVHVTLDLFGSPTVTLADKFRDEKRSINEKLNLETPGSIGSRLRLKIMDLHSAIGINDRFIFINELFEGNMRNYDDVLGLLNSCASLGDALEVFNQTRTTHGWSDELSSVERLLDFIHRRYA